MAIEARNRPLPEWLNRVRTGQTVLPRFQRFEAWDRGNVEQMFNTILAGLPVGAALVLEVGDEEKFTSRQIAGAPTPVERATEHLLDGQQRLTALWRGLNNSYDDVTYFLWLEEDEETGLPESVWAYPRWRKKGSDQRYPVWLEDPKALWRERIVPLDLCRPDLDASAYWDWAEQAITDDAERKAFIKRMGDIRTRLAGFNLPFLSLPASTRPETALDVFMKMNTTAAPLSMFDIVVAQVEADAGQSLHELVADLKQAVPALQAYYEPESLILYVAALLQDRPPTKATYLDRKFAKGLVGDWTKIRAGAGRAVQLLEAERILDKQRLPTEVVVPVLAALWADAPESMDGEGRARLLMQRYLWRAFFSTRYENSTNSRALEDYRALRGLIAGASADQPDLFDDQIYPLPTEDELLGARWPKNKDRLARAVLAVALKQGAVDFADGRPVSREELGRREYHHLYPDAYLRKRGYSERDIYRALNCAVVTWATNRNMSDKAPLRYLSERKDGTLVGDKELAGRLDSHLIPPGALEADDYDAFLQARASLVHGQMREVCGAG